MKRARITILAIALLAATAVEPATPDTGQFGAFHCEALGLELRPVSSQPERAGTGQGFLVVRARGLGHESGLRRGDVILALNGGPLDAPHRLCRISAGARASHVLTVERNGNRRVIPLFFQGPALRWGDPGKTRKKSL
jgi:S1-C subfamily serine protease